jgi:hypothetical protein
MIGQLPGEYQKAIPLSATDRVTQMEVPAIENIFRSGAKSGIQSGRALQTTTLPDRC